MQLHRRLSLGQRTTDPASPVPTSKRPALRGADERRRPLAPTRNDLPQHAIPQERGVALALVGKNNNLSRNEFSFVSCLVGQVENVADVLERGGHRLDVLRPEHIVS
jgi:hypothetical protein